MEWTTGNNWKGSGFLSCVRPALGRTREAPFLEPQLLCCLSSRLLGKNEALTTSVVSVLASTQAWTVPPLRDPGASPGCLSFLLHPLNGPFVGLTRTGRHTAYLLQAPSSCRIPLKDPCTSLLRDQQDGCWVQKEVPRSEPPRWKRKILLSSPLPSRPFSHLLGWCRFTLQIFGILPSCRVDTLPIPLSLLA